jgi:D-inositol-3-phosphate glycosyltransferase
MSNIAPKLLFITQGFSLEGGGSDVYAYELVRSVARQGIEVHVMCPGDKTKIERLAPRVTVHWHRSLRLPLLFVPFHHVQIRLRAVKIIEQSGITSVHSNNNAGAFASKKLPTIATIHHLATDEVNQHKSLFQRLIYSADIYFEKRTIHRSSAIVTDSHLVKKSLQKIAPRKPIQVLPCGVDLTFFRRRPAEAIRKKLGIKRDEILLFFPGGSRSKRKGALDLFSALRNVSQQNYRCIVSGDPRADIGWDREFRAALKNSGLQNKFTLLGEIDFSELPSYYSAADTVVYPSTMEGFGLPALESLACGRPFIGTRTGEMPYIIKNGHNGLLVDTHNPRQLQKALERLMNSAAERKKLARHARKSVESYSWDSLGKSVINLHNKIMKRE